MLWIRKRCLSKIVLVKSWLVLFGIKQHEWKITIFLNRKWKIIGVDGKPIMVYWVIGIIISIQLNLKFWF